MLYLTKYESVLGELTLVSDEENLVGLWIEGQKHFMGKLAGRMDVVEVDLIESDEDSDIAETFQMRENTLKARNILESVKAWLEQYFTGENPNPKGLPLAPKGSEFQELVWKYLCEIPYGEVVFKGGSFIRIVPSGTPIKQVGNMFIGIKSVDSIVKIYDGYFDGGYYDKNAAYIEEILAGTKTLEETDDDIAKRGVAGDANKVRVALKDNVSTLLNHAGYGGFKVYGGTFVGANPAWGDEGCMLPTTPQYLRPWSYYQGELLDGQTFHELAKISAKCYNPPFHAANI